MTHAERCAAMRAFHYSAESVRREAAAHLAAYDNDPSHDLRHLMRAAELHEQAEREELAMARAAA